MKGMYGYIHSHVQMVGVQFQILQAVESGCLKEAKGTIHPACSSLKREEQVL